MLSRLFFLGVLSIGLLIVLMSIAGQGLVLSAGLTKSPYLWIPTVFLIGGALIGGVAIWRYETHYPLG